MGRSWMGERYRQLVYLFLDQGDLIDQEATVVAVVGGISMLELRVREKLCCKDSVNFGFEQLNSISQNM